jgi:hypothetical protein
VIDVERAVRRVSQLRKLCLALQESGRRMRLAQGAQGFLGSTVNHVFLAPGDKRHATRYFLEVGSGSVFLLDIDQPSPQSAALPADAHRVEGYSEILNGPKITAVHRGCEHEILVSFDTGCALHLETSEVGSLEFDSDLFLESSADLADKEWKAHFDQHYRRVL